jgi:hypothetical protein
VNHKHEAQVPEFIIRDCRESVPGIGVVWPVVKVEGKCGCGAVEMASEVAFFIHRKDAEKFVLDKVTDLSITREEETLP